MKNINPSLNKSHTPVASFRICCIGHLTGNEAMAIRQEINNCNTNKYRNIYLDTKEVINADLSGINEIIHSAYTIAPTNSQFILIYKKGSVVEKWVDITGLDKFVQTAVIPAAY